MFKLTNNTFEDRGYLISVDDNIKTMTFNLQEFEGDNVNFKYTFKLLNRNISVEDLIDDFIDMYERKKTKICMKD